MWMQLSVGPIKPRGTANLAAPTGHRVITASMSQTQSPGLPLLHRPPGGEDEVRQLRERVEQYESFLKSRAPTSRNADGKDIFGSTYTA